MKEGVNGNRSVDVFKTRVCPEPIMVLIFISEIKPQFALFVPCLPSFSIKDILTSA